MYVYNFHENLWTLYEDKLFEYLRMSAVCCMRRKDSITYPSSRTTADTAEPNSGL
jgi:hypothetical protein